MIRGIRSFAICFSAAFVAAMIFAACSGHPLDPSAKKVEICHIPPGNPDNAHTITINSSALNAHLAHGDYEGACEVESGHFESAGQEAAGSDGVLDLGFGLPTPLIDVEVERKQRVDRNDTGGRSR